MVIRILGRLRTAGRSGTAGKLAADLTWPKLRQRWIQPRTTPSGERLTAADQKAIWEHAAQVARTPPSGSAL